MDNIELNQKFCKYCGLLTESITSDYMKCNLCNENVHLKCLRKGAVPGGLCGDVFYTFTCEDCSPTGSEKFERDKMPWLQAIVLVLHHMQTRTPGLARKGFFHWKIHIATFINKYWDILFNKDFKRKKKWMGTISGTLSHYNPHIFLSGTLLFNDQGWWTLTYPKLPPRVTVWLNSKFLIAKQKYKDNKLQLSDQEIFDNILCEKKIPTEFLTKTSISDITQLCDSELTLEDTGITDVKVSEVKQSKNDKNFKKAPLLPSLEKLSEEPSKKLKRKNIKINVKDDLSTVLIGNNINSADTREQENVTDVKRKDS